MKLLLDGGARMTEMTSDYDISAILEVIDNNDTRGLSMFIELGADIYQTIKSIKSIHLDRGCL